MYATVNKQTTSTNVSSIPDSPSGNIHAKPLGLDTHAEADAEIEKLRSMTFNSGQNSKHSSSTTTHHQVASRTKSFDQHHRPNMTLQLSDQTDSAFTSQSSRTASFSSSNSSPGKTRPTRKVCERPSVTTPDFIELEVAANRVRTNIQELRKDLNTLRKIHVDNTRNFKNDIQKKLLEFRKKASKVDDFLQSKIDQNNNSIFANDHPVREKRHRLTGDQIEYNKKLSSTEYRLQNLEGAMENVRLDVVHKKRVDNPDKLGEFEEEIVNITRSLTDVRNKFLGINDMLQRVMQLETEVIQKEEVFLKEEPQKLDTLIDRCKALSGTLQTLNKLAKMQSEVTNRKQQHQQQNSFPDYQEISDVNHNSQRGVRFQR